MRDREEYKQDMVYGIRPVIEAIDSGKEAEKVLIQKGSRSDNFAELMKLIKERSVPYQFVPIEKLNRLTRKNHQGVVSFRKTQNLVMDKGCPRGNFDLGVRCRRTPAADVLTNARGKQEWLLGDNRNLMINDVQFQIPKVASIKSHATGGRVVKSDHQVQQRRLTGTGWTDNPDGFALVDRNRNVTQDRRVSVGKADVLAGDHARW